NTNEMDIEERVDAVSAALEGLVERYGQPLLKDRVKEIKVASPQNNKKDKGKEKVDEGTASISCSRFSLFHHELHTLQSKQPIFKLKERTNNVYSEHEPAVTNILAVKSKAN